MTIRKEEFDALAAEVGAGRVTEDQVIRWMASTAWPGHSVLECSEWWQAEYGARRPGSVGEAAQDDRAVGTAGEPGPGDAAPEGRRA